MAHTPAVRALMALARAKAADPISGQTQVLKALTVWFASPEAITADGLPTDLIDQLVSLGIARQAALVSGARVLAKPMSGRSRYGAPAPYEGMPAVRRVASEEPEMRARFVLASSRRLTEALGDGAYLQARANEKRYLDAHVAAGRKRRAAAREVDEVAKSSSVLVWKTMNDDRVDSVCRALEGRLFTVDSPPDGLYPGAAHPRCRCHASAWTSPLLRG